MTSAELRDSQWEVVRDTAHHLLVTAGAGTGKTTTVIAKVLYLLGVPVRGETIAHPLALRDVACITYTTRAAAELEERIRHALREAGRADLAWRVEDARIGTLHGFCRDILREFALRASHAPATHVLTESEAELLRDEAARDAITAALDAGGDADLEALLGEWELDRITAWVEQLVDQPELLAALAALAAPAGDHGLTPAERALAALARQARSLADERLRREHAIDFGRMILWTRELLRDRPDVLAALRRRIRVLIIDEFQDVDPLQKDIAWLLGSPESRSPETPRLVLVGDPKQSIYRFRRADVALWNQVEREFTEGGLGRRLPLEDNFRSVPAVLGFVDAAIGPLLDTPVDDEQRRPFEVPYASLRPARPEEAKHAVEVIVTPARDDGKACAADVVRDADARAVALRMLELHDDERIPWRDMAILLRASGAAATYDGALRAAGIPTYLLRGEGFFERREVVDLILALETVRDPHDDRAFMGFLRSPFVGVADETLLAIALAARPPSYFPAAAGVHCAEHELVATGVALIERLAALRDRIPTHELLQRLLDESGYAAHLALQGTDGLQALANVRGFLRLARDEGASTVGDFLRQVSDVREGSARVGDERLYDETEDVVTITTIHGAKGLEWPVVFWCDLVRGLHNENSRLLLDRDAMRLGRPDIRGDQQDPRWQELHERLALENEAELRRLRYVAATRARDRLILGGIPLGTFNGRGSTAAALRRMLPRLEQLAGGGTLSYEGKDGRTYEALVRVATVPPERDEDAPPEEGPVLDAATLDLPPAAIAARAGRGRHSATELLACARCPRKHWFRYIAHLPEPAITGGDDSPDSPDGPGGDARERAIVRGQIVHDVLEHDDDGSDRDALIESAVARWDEDAPAVASTTGAAYREEVRREIERIAGDPAYRAVADLPGARRELRFLHIAPDGRAVEGAFDLIAPHGDGYIILDVKTGRGDAAEARTKALAYGPQRDAYITAAEAVGGRPVEHFAFQFSRTGVQVGGPVSDAERLGARERVAAAIAGIERGDAPLTSHPDECRFCGYRAAGWCPGVDGA